MARNDIWDMKGGNRLPAKRHNFSTELPTAGGGKYPSMEGKIPNPSYNKPSGGSSSQTGSGSYGSYSSVPDASDSYKNALDDYYKEMMAEMRRQQREAEREMRRKINQGVDKLEAQKPLVENQFQDSAQQAYIQYMQSQKKLPQMLAAQGLSGGASESSMVGLESDYGNNVNTLRDSYNQALRDIDSDIADLRASGDLAIAENAGTYSQKIADLAAQQKLDQLNALKGSASVSGGYSSGSLPKLTYSQALDILESGVDSPNARDVYKEYTGVDYAPQAPQLSDYEQKAINYYSGNINSWLKYTPQENRESELMNYFSKLQDAGVDFKIIEELARQNGITLIP